MSDLLIIISVTDDEVFTHTITGVADFPHDLRPGAAGGVTIERDMSTTSAGASAEVQRRVSGKLRRERQEENGER